MSRGELRLVCEAPNGAEAGDVLLAVPRSALLIEPRVPPPGAPQLPWEVRLALRLLDAAMGQDDSPGAQLWAAYAGALLPAPESLAQPSCLSAVQLAELQEGSEADGAAARGLAQQERLKEMMPMLVGEPGAGGCGPLQWSLACVRSRGFACNARGGGFRSATTAAEGEDERGAPDDEFALVPFLDCANHADSEGELNADFAFEALPGDIDGDIAPNFLAGPGEQAASDGEGEEGFVLRATKPIAQGEEIRIQYHDGMDNKRMLACYGYSVEGNPLDRVPLMLPPAAASAVRAAAQAAEEKARAAGEEANARRAAAVAASVVEAGADGPDTEGCLLELLLALLEDIRDLPTSADDDAAMLAAAPLSPPLRAAVAYRLERKRLAGVVAEVLQAAAAAATE